MAQRNATILVEGFTDNELNEISQKIDDEFNTVIYNLEIRSAVPITPEVKHGECGDDEYRYLLVDDKIQAVAFIRRTDFNHFEIMLSSFY